MLRINNLHLSLDRREQELRQQAQKMLRVRPADITACRLARISVDARDQRDVHFVVSADVSVSGDEQAP